MGGHIPEVLKHEGEAYRQSLKEKISELGLSNNIRFINRYVELSELLELLQMTDAYLFTSKDPNQAVSGTFAYAMSCGCPVISTAIPHAKEMLSADTGILVDFNDPQGFSDALLKILNNDVLRSHMSRNAVMTSGASEWSNVAVSHKRMLQSYLPEQPLILNFPEAPANAVYRLANLILSYMHSNKAYQDLPVHQDLTHSAAFFKRAALGILFLNRIGKITEINPYALEIFGYKKEEIVGKGIDVLIPLLSHNVISQEKCFADFPNSVFWGRKKI